MWNPRLKEQPKPFELQFIFKSDFYIFLHASLVFKVDFHASNAGISARFVGGVTSMTSSATQCYNRDCLQIWQIHSNRKTISDFWISGCLGEFSCSKSGPKVENICFYFVYLSSRLYGARVKKLSWFRHPEPSIEPMEVENNIKIILRILRETQLFQLPQARWRALGGGITSNFLHRLRIA